MVDEALRMMQMRTETSAEIDSPLAELFPQHSFDEVAYLQAYPDVAAAMVRGDVRSGYSHFINYGLREGRMPPGNGQEPRNRMIRFATSSNTSSGPSHLTQHFESLIISRSGGVFIIGWMDDSASPVDCIRIIGGGWRLAFDGKSLARVRRRDVEDALSSHGNHAFGYFGFVFGGEPIDVYGEFKIEICLSDGRTASIATTAKQLDDSKMRDTVLSYLASAHHFGNPQVRSIACADAGLGIEIINHNRSITDGILASRYVEKFGPRRRKHLGSIVVCLYGKMEYLFVQNALFGGRPGIEDYEFVYVCNSPELAESLLREARIAERVYGVDQTIVILPGNAGFGGANNAAIQVAETDRLLITNPDVFPYDNDWAAKHTSLVGNLPREQTQLFGAPLYYDNGSLMHGGMYFEVDKGPSREDGRTIEWQLLRVEHYGKGAPPNTARFLSPRPVPAVTGAFISCDRAWFEQLGGFTEDYVFGHYEDADLCLKSIQAGTVPWLHNLKLWHLEGKGSTRLPVHDGGSTINRWLFSATWGEFISENLVGPNPTHPAFHGADSAQDTEPSQEKTTTSAGYPVEDPAQPPVRGNMVRAPNAKRARNSAV